MITLYQFPISHYCEKVRWALDYKNIDYRVKNLLPGLHVKKARALTGSAEVPIIKHEKNVISNSSAIISYIDEVFTDKMLTSADNDIRDASLEWERFVDNEIGPNLRVYFYNTLLKHPNILIPIFAHNGPWYGKHVLKFIFPRLNLAMRRLMNINDKTANQASYNLQKGIDKLNNHLQKHSFLAGDSFGRADLAAASLLAPIIQPVQYGLIWPDELPDPLQSSINEWSQQVEWAECLYGNYR